MKSQVKEVLKYLYDCHRKDYYLTEASAFVKWGKDNYIIETQEFDNGCEEDYFFAERLIKDGKIKEERRFSYNRYYYYVS